jgi:hypothetical protein
LAVVAGRVLIATLSDSMRVRESRTLKVAVI